MNAEIHISRIGNWLHLAGCAEKLLLLCLRQFFTIYQHNHPLHEFHLNYICNKRSTFSISTTNSNVEYKTFFGIYSTFVSFLALFLLLLLCHVFSAARPPLELPPLHLLCYISHYPTIDITLWYHFFFCVYITTTLSSPSTSLECRRRKCLKWWSHDKQMEWSRRNPWS